MLFERLDRGVDELGIVADRGQHDRFGQRPSKPIQLGPDSLDDIDRVLAHGAADVENHCGSAAHPGGRDRAFGSIFRVAEVGDADRRAVLGRDDDAVEVFGQVDAAERPQQHLPLALFDRSARHLDVLVDQRAAHLIERQAEGVELLDVDDDVDFAGAAAGDADLADAVGGLNHPRDLLVGDLGQRSQAHVLRRHDHRHHRIRIGIDFGDDRRQQLWRHVLHRARHFFAHVVGRVVDVAVEHEADGDGRRALGHARRQFVDAGDAAERLFHRLDHRRRHLVGAGAGQRQLHVHGGGVGLREQVHAEAAEREDAQHHERHHQHRGEHRTTDAEFREHDVPVTCAS